jgi:hypothetical protein
MTRRLRSFAPFVPVVGFVALFAVLRDRAAWPPR